MPEMKARPMMKCPHCHEDIRQWIALCVNLSNRMVFSLILTAILLAFDAFVYWRNGHTTQLYAGILGYRHVLAWSSAARFAYTYFFFYPFFVHISHKKPGDVRYAYLPVSLGIPLLFSMSFFVRIAGTALGLLGPYGTSLR